MWSRKQAEEVIASVKKEHGFKKKLDIKIGTMIEIPRAALTADEIAWWNDYHAKVWDILSPQLDGVDLAWLEGQCAPL